MTCALFEVKADCPISVAVTGVNLLLPSLHNRHLLNYYLKEGGSFSSGMLQMRALNVSNRLALLMHTLRKQ